MSIADEKTISVTTFRRSGEGVATPVWVNQVSDGRIGFWTSAGSGNIIANGLGSAARRWNVNLLRAEYHHGSGNTKDELRNDEPRPVDAIL